MVTRTARCFFIAALTVFLVLHGGGQASAGLVDALDEVTKAMDEGGGDSEPAKEEAPAPAASPAASPAAAPVETKAPETGITTDTQEFPDGSRVITETDHGTGTTKTTVVNKDGSKDIVTTNRDGFVTDEQYEPAPEEPSASMYDPETGITTTSKKNPDGSRTVTKTDRDGNVIYEEIIPPRGKEPVFAKAYDPDTKTATVARKNPDGTRTVTRAHNWTDSSGAKHTLEADSDGNQSETVTAPDGTRTTTLWDNKGGETKAVRSPDGAETVTDTRGVVTRSQTGEEGITNTVVTDKRGNRYELASDNKGNIVSETEKRITPPDPGQEYFESVLGGRAGEWDELPGDVKGRYADPGTQTRISGERKALLDRQEADKKMAGLQSELDAAVASGDKKEIKRIETLMDGHHDATAQLYELTEEEKASMGKKQTVRDEVRSEIMQFAEHSMGGISAVDKAKRKIAQAEFNDSWGEASLRELTYTGAMTDEVEEDLYRQREIQLRADNEVIAAQQYLKREGLSPEQKEAAQDMLESSLMKRANASAAMNYDYGLMGLGAASDIALVGVGGAVGRGVGKLAGRGGAKIAPKIKPSSMTSAERQAIHDAKAQEQVARKWREGVPPEDGGESYLIQETEPVLEPRTNLSEAEQAKLFEPGRNLTPQELVDKAELLVQQRRAGQPVTEEWFPGMGEEAVTEGGTVIERGRPAPTPKGDTLIDRGDATVLTEGETVIDPGRPRNK